MDGLPATELVPPISEVLRALEEASPHILQGEWEIRPGADGYGEAIVAICDAMETSDPYRIRGEELFPLLMEGKQYFHDVELRSVDRDVVFGLFDSTYYYIRSADIDMLRKATSGFNDVREA